METNDEQYALKWTDFHSKIISSLQNLRNDFDFVDVTLACENQSFSAHKLILSACSTYFCKLLKENPCQHPIIILNNITEKSLENLLLFMYNGEVNLHPNQLNDFLKAAKFLQIQGLTDVVEHNIIPNNRKSSTECNIKLKNELECINLDEEPSSVSADNYNKLKQFGSFNESTQRSMERNYSESEEMEEIPPQTSQKSEDEIQEHNILPNNQKLSTEFNIKLKNEPECIDLDDEPSIVSEPTINYSKQKQFVHFNRQRSLDANYSGSEEISSMSFEMEEIPPLSSQTNEDQRYTASFCTSQASEAQNKRSTKCPVCRKSYSTASNLRAHILNVHSQPTVNNWVCRQCGKKFKTKHYQINHEMSVHGIKQKSKKPSYLYCLNEDTI